MRMVLVVAFGLTLGGCGALAASGGDWTSPTLGRMKWIPAGTFTMGSPETESWRGPDEVQHTVTLTHGFLLMEHEVTQGEWQAVMGGNPVETGTQYWSGKDQGPCSPVGVGSDLPVVCVSWQEAVVFANVVSAREGLTPSYTISGDAVTVNAGASGYRLPTEAQWEWAARGGQATRYAGSNELCTVANVVNAAREVDYTKLGIDVSRWPFADCDDGVLFLARVKSLRPNGFGLYDMSGNVFEWAWDWYGDYPMSAARDPSGPSAGSRRVFRGGAWIYGAVGARVASRVGDAPSTRSTYLGLRLSRPVP